MENAIFTHEVYQNQLENSDLEYVPVKHQPYFEFEIKGEKYLIGLDKILECLVIAEKIDEIPKLGNYFWSNILEKYGVNYYDYILNLSQEEK